MTSLSSAPRAGRREWTGLAVIALPCLVYAMDLTVLNLAVPALSAELKPTSTQLLWIVDIYGFLVAGLLITMGTLGDRIGRRRLLLIGAAAFGGRRVAAFSTSAAMLIAMRAVLGIAGATLAPSTLSLIRNMFPDQRSGRSPSACGRQLSWAGDRPAGGWRAARALLVGVGVPGRGAGDGAAAGAGAAAAARIQGPECRPARHVERGVVARRGAAGDLCVQADRGKRHCGTARGDPRRRASWWGPRSCGGSRGSPTRCSS